MRFRVVFWWVTWLAALPSLVSGWVLLRHFRLRTLCAAERQAVTAAELRATLAWARIHEWGRVGAMVAGLLVIAYGVAWAFERGRRRALMAVLCGGVLLPSLAAAMWSGRVVPWRALEPPISVAAGQTIAAPPEWGGPGFCREHADELRRLEIVYGLHLGAGTLAVLLTLALAPAAASWREARSARS
jgi:hypothetical protein